MFESQFRTYYCWELLFRTYIVVERRYHRTVTVLSHSDNSTYMKTANSSVPTTVIYHHTHHHTWYCRADDAFAMMRRLWTSRCYTTAFALLYCCRRAVILLPSRCYYAAVALLYCCRRVVILLPTRYYIAAVAPLYCCACVLINSACVFAKAILIYVTVRRVHVDNNSPLAILPCHDMAWHVMFLVSLICAFAFSLRF